MTILIRSEKEIKTLSEKEKLRGLVIGKAALNGWLKQVALRETEWQHECLSLKKIMKNGIIYKNRDKT